MTSTIAGVSVEYGQIEQVAVHFDDLDAAGLMHNARYAVILERALSLFWDRHGFTYASGRPSNSDVILAVREFAITYHVPIRGTGPLDVHFWIDRLGETSASYGFRFLSPDHETVHAEGRRVMVKFDPRTGRPSPWTSDGRDVAATLTKE
jgi:acyl-CoA thioester hydrolase